MIDNPDQRIARGRAGLHLDGPGIWPARRSASRSRWSSAWFARSPSPPFCWKPRRRWRSRCLAIAFRCLAAT
ncbi:hypothetical protein ACRAWD_22310 [Caulobacter segnis]